MPKGVDLVEPTKLCAEGVAILWRHWRNIQKTNQRPLIFIEALPKDIRPHSNDTKWPKRKVKSTGSKAKGKGKGKAKYVEVDESSDSESSSDDRSEESSEEESSSEDDENDGRENGGREVVKWGPPSGPKHIRTKEGGSGLSASAKERLRRKAQRRKGKGKDVPEAIGEPDSDKSAERRTRSPPQNRNLGTDDVDMTPPRNPRTGRPSPRQSCCLWDQP